MVFFSCDIWDSGADCHAGNKARDDVNSILSSMGYHPLKIAQVSLCSMSSNILIKLKKHIGNAVHWANAIDNVNPDDVVIIQFPLPAHTIFSSCFLSMMKRKRIKIILLIHDVEMLRQESSSLVTRLEERPFIHYADQIIVHNKKMGDALATKFGILRNKIQELGLFDYLIDNRGKIKCFNRNGPIIVAGNLASSKAGYLTTLDAKEMGLSLYGPNLDSRLEKEYDWRGSYASSDLVNHLDGSFGLVWDGEGANGCVGPFGEYLKINNPHKASLFLACDIPVIVWSQSALASFVVGNEVGIAVESLSEAATLIRSMSSDDIEHLHQGAALVGERLRSGFYTRSAIGRALDCLQ